MGLFDILFGSGDNVRIEGRQSDRHSHSDGTMGRDTYAAKVSCRDGVCTEKNAGFGHISVGDDGSQKGHVK